MVEPRFDGFVDAATLDGNVIWYAGSVLCRQRFYSTATIVAGAYDRYSIIVIPIPLIHYQTFPEY